MAFSSRFSIVIVALWRNGIGQYELKALPGLTQIGSENRGAYLLHPMAKKSPTGTSTEGSFSSSQYMRRTERRQLPVGVIQMCWTNPEPLISANVNVVPGSTTTNGFSFQPCPSSLASLEATPVFAMPPLPFSPVKFSGLMEKDLAFETR